MCCARNGIRLKRKTKSAYKSVYPSGSKDILDAHQFLFDCNLSFEHVYENPCTILLRLSP
jgi:hypothetical protein